MPLLAVLDRAPGEPVRRYGPTRPGELVPVEVKKLGRTPTAAVTQSWAGRPAAPNEGRRDGAGYTCLPTALDDHTRPAYTEDLPDETALTCTGFPQRPPRAFAPLGITVERVLAHNTWAHSKNTWRNTCRDLAIPPHWTRPWRPQTNGKIERFHRTLLDEWASQKPYTSVPERMEAFTDRLHRYHYRPHLNRRPPNRQPRHQPLRTTSLVLQRCLA